jgi:hypothetical protein
MSPADHPATTRTAPATALKRPELNAVESAVVKRNVSAVPMIEIESMIVPRKQRVRNAVDSVVARRREDEAVMTNRTTTLKKPGSSGTNSAKSVSVEVMIETTSVIAPRNDAQREGERGDVCTI